MNNYKLIAVITLLGAVSAFASAENLRKVAEANGRGFEHAMKTKDIGWFKKVTAPDFYEESRGKKNNRDKAIGNMSQLFAMGNISVCSTKVLNVTPRGNGMMIRVSAHVVMTFQAPGAKKPSKMIGDSTYEEKWSKDHGRWMIHSLKTLKDTGTIDGKPMPPEM